MARTIESVVSLAIGAAVGLGVMRLLGFGGGIPAGIFAFVGASVGEWLYNMSSANGKKDDDEVMKK
jgi:hypothetical protein